MKSKQLLNKKIFLLAVAFACLLGAGLFFLQIFVFPNIRLANEQKTELQITPYNQALLAELAQTSTLAIQSTPTSTLPGVFAVGMTIKVEGTGADGLRMRKNPGTEQEVLYIAPEGTTYEIVDGPEIKDSLIWWKLESKQDRNQTGWSVQDYFSVILDD